MQLKIRISLLLLSAALAQCLLEAELYPADKLNLDAWTEASFLRLPCFERAEWAHGSSRSLNVGPFSAPAEDAFSQTLATWDSIAQLLDDVSTQQRQIMQHFGWFHDPLLPRGVNHTWLSARLTDLRQQHSVKPPFVQRVELPANATVFVWGDLHGSLHPFLRHLGMLRRLGVLDAQWSLAAHVHLLFLGDYVDRGPYGIEVIATALRLKRANPGRVWMVRGNHEDAALNAQSTFAPELAGKYPNTPREQRNQVFAWYHTLPQAIFLGQRGAADSPPQQWVLACHGGIEPGYDPAPFLSWKQPQPAATGHHDVQWLQHMQLSGVRTSFALIPGLLRAEWLRSLPAALQSGIGQSLANMLQQGRNSFGPLAGEWVHESEAAVGADGQSLQPRESQGYPPFSTHLNDTEKALLFRFDQAASAGGFGLWPASPMSTGAFPVGFLWNDFYVDDAETVLGYNRGRGLILGRPVTQHWLQQNGVVGIFRGHQHNNAPAAGPMLSRLKTHRGIYDNWDGAGMVYTFLSAAETAVLGYNSASVGVLRMGGQLGDDEALFAGDRDACGKKPTHAPREPPNAHSAGQLPDSWRLWQCQSDLPVQRVQFGGGWKRASRPMGDAPTPAEAAAALGVMSTRADATCLQGRVWQSVWWQPVVRATADAEATVHHACEMLPLPDSLPASGWASADEWLPSLQCDLMRG